MSLQDLDPTLSSPKRLATLGMLASSRSVEFAFIAEHLGLSDSDLSKQMRALADAGYVKNRKTGSGAKRRTWFTMTSKGRQALNSHLAALNALVLIELPPPEPVNDLSSSA